MAVLLFPALRRNTLGLLGQGADDGWDAPGVLYSATPKYKSLADGKLRSWVLYYSYYVNTDRSNNYYY